MDLKNVKVVASYEAKLVCRSFIFWVLFSLTIGGISFLQWLVQSKITWGGSWLMHHQTFSFPLVNAYLYNIVQTFITIFMVIDLFTRERRRGTIEALHARPVSNGEYLLGKTAGIISVLLAVGFLSLLVCCGINIWGSKAPFNPLYYLYYFLTLTIPSLVFFTGFALWVTWLTRSRVLSTALLLVFLYYSIIILPDIFHGLFDFTGSALSNIFSVATGHAEGRNYLLHRLAYLLTGIGFICWTIRLQERLPNKRQTVVRFSYAGITLLLVGILLGSIYAYGFIQEKSVRHEYRAAFARHAEEKSCRVTRHDITLQQTDDRLTSTSELTLRNPNKESLSRLVLYLNPGLEVTSLKEHNKSLAFARDGQVVLIERPLAAGDSIRLSICYSGIPDGRVTYLDLDDASYYDTKRSNNFFHLGRRHVLASNASLVLVPEAMWYPMAIPPVNPDFSFLSSRDYTRYCLKLVAPVQPVVLSQGEQSRQGDTLQFLPLRPLEGISLCAGNYEHQTINLQDIQVDWYYFKGNNFMTPFVEQFNKEKFLEQVEISVLTHLGKIFSSSEKNDRISNFMQRQDWYTGEGSRLLLVETPLPFVSHARVWKGRSEYVQPGMVLLGERGMGMEMGVYTFFSRKGAEQEDESIRLMRGANSITALFFPKTSIQNTNNPFLERLNFHKAYTNPSRILYPYCCLSLFLEPTATINSPRYGTIDRVLKQFIAKRGNYDSNISRTILTENSDIAAYTHLQDHTLEEAIQDRNISPYVLQEMVNLKMEALLNHIATYTSQGTFRRFLRSFYSTHHGEIPLDTLCKAIQTDLGFDFEPILQTWESQIATSFRLQDLKVERVEREYGDGWMAHFQIWNTGKHPGFIVYSFARNSYHLLLQPGECKEIRVRGSSNMFTLDLGISRNLPSVINITDSGITQDTTEGIRDISPSVFNPKPEEIIVDNEDPGFRLIFPENKLLDFFFSKGSDSKDHEEILQTGPWHKEFSDGFYGNEYKSIYTKRDGSGSCKAEWSTDIQEDGIYEIFVIHPPTLGRIPGAQYYTVRGEGQKAEEILLPWEREKWVSLGQFKLKRGKSYVVLDDRTSIGKEDEKDKRYSSYGKIIVADAVKWVKIKMNR